MQNDMYDIPIENSEASTMEEVQKEAADPEKLDRDFVATRWLNYADFREEVRRALTNDEKRKSDVEESLDKRFRRLTLEEYRKKYSETLNFVRNFINVNKISLHKGTDPLTGAAIDYKLSEVSRMMTSATVGLDCLEEAFEDPTVTDIYVIKYDEIYVERGGQNVRYPHVFNSQEDYKNFVQSLLLNDDKQLDTGEGKIQDFEIYSMRGNAISNEVASKDICLTLRKHAEKAITLENMIKNGQLNDDMADFLRLIVLGECACCFVGITGSGKTTFMKAVLEDALSETTLNRFHIESRNKRILVCEDTPELTLSTDNTVNLRTVKTGQDSTSVTLDSLVISSLRMKPKYVICGEIRSVEAKNWVEAANSGHSSLATLHANTIENALSRLVVRYSETVSQMKTELVREIIGGAMDYCVIIDDIPRGKIGRRVTSIHEVGFNQHEQRIETKPIVSFNFADMSWTWHNNIGQKQEDLLLRRGVPYEEIESLKNRIDKLIRKS